MKKIVLFDLDGVILDTESQYTTLWDRLGKVHLDQEGFGTTIKGQTLNQILQQHVSDPSLASLLEEEVDRFECEMDYGFIPGARDFLAEVKKAGIPCAVVTSSNQKKMEKFYSKCPDFKDMVDVILTSEHFSKSKPDPECFLKGMEILGAKPEDTIVFEDSIHGLTAGRASGAFVVGLATTNSRDVIAHLCDMVIDNFEGLSLNSDSANCTSKAFLQKR